MFYISLQGLQAVARKETYRMRQFHTFYRGPKPAKIIYNYTDVFANIDKKYISLLYDWPK